MTDRRTGGLSTGLPGRGKIPPHVWFSEPPRRHRLRRHLPARRPARLRRHRLLELRGHNTGDNLIIFEVNPLHNIVHLAIGALLLVSCKTVAAAKGSNTAVGAVYLLVGILGLFLIDTSANILSLDGADNVLHFASAFVLLGVGLSQDKNVRGNVPVG